MGIKGTGHLVWKVYPILAGEFGPCPEGYIRRDGNLGQGHNIPSIICVVENEEKGRRILVDASFSSPEEVRREMGIFCDRNLPLDISLKRHGIDPEEVGIVVLTHLHWDHAGGIVSLPKAPLMCQRCEYEWLLKSYKWEVGYPTWLIEAVLKNKNRLELVEGNFAVDEGIEIWLCGGHTIGSQAVVVTTESGPCIITGDNVMVYENVLESVPIGLFHNLHECLYFMERIKRSSCCFIPSHDWRVVVGANQGVNKRW